MGYAAFFGLYASLEGQVRFAYSTVHSAWGNEVGRELAVLQKCFYRVKLFNCFVVLVLLIHSCAEGWY